MYIKLGGYVNYRPQMTQNFKTYKRRRRMRRRRRRRRRRK